MVQINDKTGTDRQSSQRQTRNPFRNLHWMRTLFLISATVLMTPALPLLIG